MSILLTNLDIHFMTSQIRKPKIKYYKKFLHIRIKQEEQNRWHDAAEALGLKYSEWVRMTLNREANRLGIDYDKEALAQDR